MTLNQTDRPRFYEQQYLDSADLDALVDYDRVGNARHALGAHSWGIAAGLQLIEKTSKTGTDVYVQPGFAWDGFGRSIAVLSPYKVPTEPFKNITFITGVDDGTPPGHLVDVWLAYTATPRGVPSFGFEACSVDGQYARLFESFQIVIGEKPGHSDRHNPITVGQYTVDAEQIVQKLGSATDPLLTDESVAYQTFPDNWDTALWLIPLGSVRWVPPVNPLNTGNFSARNDADKTTSDHKRRYIGVVTETVDAARGFVRVRSRDASAYAPTIWNTTDDQNLLWVEGSLRVQGDAKLLGGELIFRNTSNTDAGRPLTIQRRETNAMVPAGSDLWAQIGSSSSPTGSNRFVVGPVTGPAATDYKEVFVVKDDAHVGIGEPNPTAAALTIRGLGGGEDLLSFESASGAPTWLVSTKANGNAGLNFAEAAGDSRLFLGAGGNVGLGTQEPKHRLEIHGEDNALVVVSDATTGTAQNAGMELRTKSATGAMYIDFANGSTDLTGGGTPDFKGRISYNEVNSNDFSIRGGRVGIATAQPTHPLHVEGNTGARVSRMFISGGAGSGWSSLSFNAHHNDANTDWVFPDATHRSVTVEMDDTSGGGRFEVWSTTSGAPAQFTRRLRVDGEVGDVYVGEHGGNVGIGLTTPQGRLHVIGNKAGNAGSVSSHIAVIENQDTTGDGDVLALQVRSTPAQPGNNFITFFSGSSDIGAVEGNGGGGVTYRTTSADYAEWMPRDDGEAPMSAGDVVGVFAGRIRRMTDGADHILVVSTSPAMLANSPGLANQANYEVISMLGQVPVKVRGAVNAGDILVASGKNDGFAVGVSATDATIDQHARSIGVAWESKSSADVGTVRCAVGLPTTHSWRSVMRSLEQSSSTSKPRKRARASKRASGEDAHS